MTAMRVGLLDRTLGALARTTGRLRVWYRWPFPIALPIIVGQRVRLRQHNLTDTETQKRQAPDFPDAREFRSPNGCYNDLSVPCMGMQNARFGRNMPLADTFGERPPRLFDPSPRLVSNELLARREFVPVPHLNVLAAAWIQFMVHDWLSHGSNDKCDTPWDVPLPSEDPWTHGKLTVLPTLPDGPYPEDEGRPAAYTNVETGWWDASQVYGSGLDRQSKVREDPATGQPLGDGKLGLTPQGLLPIENKTLRGKPSPNLELAGVNGNWWIGLSVLHTLFAREHNAIVDRLRLDHPDKSGEWLFQKARLVNAALIAKIHTVEWTPALMNSPAGRMAMRGNLWGVLGETLQPRVRPRRRGRSAVRHSWLASGPSWRALCDDRGVRRGLPAALADAGRFLVPRLPHRQGSAGNDARQGRRRPSPPGALTRSAWTTPLTHWGPATPARSCLHNYPNTLRDLDRLDSNGVFFDIATIDILRDRERGVPRYCAFRRRINAQYRRPSRSSPTTRCGRRSSAAVYMTTSRRSTFWSARSRRANVSATAHRQASASPILPFASSFSWPRAG